MRKGLTLFLGILYGLAGAFILLCAVAGLLYLVWNFGVVTMLTVAVVLPFWKAVLLVVVVWVAVMILNSIKDLMQQWQMKSAIRNMEHLQKELERVQGTGKEPDITRHFGFPK